MSNPTPALFTALLDRLTLLRDATAAHAEAIACDPDNRATGLIESRSTPSRTVLAPAAKRWREGERIGIKVGGYATRATIRVLHAPHRVVMAVPDENIPSGNGLAATEYEVLQRMVVARLEHVIADVRDFRWTCAAQVAAVLLGLEAPRWTSIVIPAQIRDHFATLLTAEQVDAWGAAMARDVCLLAPPGVGKSVVLGSLAAAMSAMGRPVVLMAPTRQAVRQLTQAYDHARRSMRRPGLLSTSTRAGRVSASTVAAAYMRHSTSYAGASVLVDEVSMATLPSLIAGLRDAEHIVLGGDLFQLGPVVNAPEWARSASSCTPFGIDPASAASHRAVVRLRASQRIPAPIATLLRDTVYGPLGPTGHDAQDRPLAGTPLDMALTLVNCAGVGRAEATDLLYGAMRRMHATASATPEESRWLVLAPTHARAQAVASQVGKAMTVSTVHAAQGAEARVVVLDLLGATPSHPWFGARRAIDDGARLLTVALSRASRHMVVALDLDRFIGTVDNHWHRVINTAIAHGLARAVAVRDLADCSPLFHGK